MSSFSFREVTCVPEALRDHPRYAAHVGAEYRLSSVFALFGRAARAFRLPNADERVAAGNPFGVAMPANFALTLAQRVSTLPLRKP